jgi:50S ribosomal protein L16 3-hydroxylase
VLFRSQPATAEPGRIPAALQSFAADAVARSLADSRWLACALGEVLSEPKPGVWFETSALKPEAGRVAGVCLDRRSRMLYDDWHVFINGESFQASGRDATVMRRLADQRSLQARDLAALSMPARVLLDEWIAAGWLLPGAARGSEGGTT